MKYTYKNPLVIAVLTLALSSCSQQDTPTSGVKDNKPSIEGKAPAQFMLPTVVPQGKPIRSNWKGTTWRVLEGNIRHVRVGADEGTDQSRGDTSVYNELPLLCLKYGNQIELRLTPSYPGGVMDSVEMANRVCLTEFGEDWRMARVSDAKEDGTLEGIGQLDTRTRFWVNNDRASANPWNSDGVGEQVKLPSTTKVLGQIDRNALLSVNEDSIAMKTDSPLFSHLKKGDIIVSDATDMAPEGFIRKVQQFVSTGTGTVVNIITSDATLEDIVEDGDVLEEQSLSTADIDYSLSGEMIREMKAEEMTAQRTKSFKLFEYSKKPFCLYDHDNGRRFRCDSGSSSGLKSKVPRSNYVSISTKLDARADAYFGLRIKRFRIRNFNTGIKLNQKASVYVKGRGKYNWNKDKELDKWRIVFKPIRFWIGIVPVVIRPSMVPTMGTSGYVKASLDYKVTQIFKGKYGVSYKRGRGWKGVRKRKFTTKSKLYKAEAKAKAKAYIGLKVIMSLYARKAGYVALHGKAYGKGTAKFDAVERAYELCAYYGFTADAEARVPVISKKTWTKRVYKSGDKLIRCVHK